MQKINRLPAIALCLAIFLFAAWHACAATPDLQTTFIVAPHGHGRRCTQHHPCSLQVAQMRVRAIAPEMQSNLTVILRGGKYRLTVPLALTAQDSGRNHHAVIWRSAAGSTPILDGATRLRHWHLVNRRLNIWNTRVPAQDNSMQLFVNGRRALLARGLGCKSPAHCKYTPTGLTGVSPRLAGFQYPQDLIAVFSVRWRDFHCPVASIRGTTVTMAEPCWHNTVIDSKNGWSYASPKSRAFHGVDWFENAYELLNTPGQFYLNTHTHRIYYIPFAGQNMKHADAELPIASSLLTITGTVNAPAHDIQIRGLTFADTTWLTPESNQGYVPLQAGYLILGHRNRLPDNGEGMTRIHAAVTVLGSLRINFSDDHFMALGAAGLTLAGGTHDSIIQGSSFRDLSGGAIFVGDTYAHPANPLEKSGGNVVQGNTITRVAVEYRDNVGIMGGFNNGLLIDHNTITCLPYSGISIGWGWNYEGDGNTQRDIRITHNRIRDFMLTLYDGGAIYTQAQSPGSAVCANYIDFSGTNHGNGIYLDERSRYYQVHRNVIWNFNEKPGAGHWASAWASWSGNLTITHNWSNDIYTAPHNPGPTKVFTPNALALKMLPPSAKEVIQNSGANAPRTKNQAACQSP